ncbi:hypothetical protein DRH29_02915 [candidate division Kazan bacterium]|uniref:Uncharacterized protein n=1 Tax=candidate division Kazan bacterium TaxID=2202143 RepID=A0A420ZCI6_UNCK3|nr:MAG: hypothetical protein DRH29_02915 [candidate division Kazan bacterium]
MSLTIDCRVHFKRSRNGRKRLVEGEAPAPLPALPGNIPRVSRLMALAIRLERLVSGGEVRDYAELARLGRVSRARITQIMNLLHLAPDIQEAILFLPRTVKGRDPIRERDLRPIAAVPHWNRQRKAWKALYKERMRR